MRGIWTQPGNQIRDLEKDEWEMTKPSRVGWASISGRGNNTWQGPGAGVA